MHPLTGGVQHCRFGLASYEIMAASCLDEDPYTGTQELALNKRCATIDPLTIAPEYTRARSYAFVLAVPHSRLNLG